MLVLKVLVAYIEVLLVVVPGTADFVLVAGKLPPKLGAAGRCELVGDQHI